MTTLPPDPSLCRTGSTSNRFDDIWPQVGWQAITANSSNRFDRAVGSGPLASGCHSTILAAALLGLGVGADLPVSLAAVSEAAPQDSRGKLIGFSNLLWVADILANAAIGSLVGDLGRVGAQMIFCHIAVVALLVLVGRLTIPESAPWRSASSPNEPAPPAGRRAGPRVRELFRRPLAAPFFALIVFYVLTNLVANTNGQFGTYILVNIGGASVAVASRVMLLTVPVVIIGILWFMRIADTPSRFAYFTAGAICGVLASPNSRWRCSG